MVDLEDIGEKKAFCRCWKSEKVRGVVWCIGKRRPVGKLLFFVENVVYW